MKKPFLILLLIILLGTFFRSYQLIEKFDYAHDGDLYSWIVKDIVVDGHFRLIGQLTSAQGLYIGPIFYYLLIPFFLIFNMDPVGATVPITIMGILSVISYYFVFSKLFNQKTGLIAAFLYAVLLQVVQLDRRVVPSTPTNLWVIWYFYCVVLISRGKYQVLPLLGVLISLIWHIHIALAPALVAIPAAILSSRKIPSIKNIFLFLVVTLITSIPFLIFELRHNFSQTLSFISNFSTNHGGGVGLDKLNLIMIKVSSNIDKLFFSPQTFPFNHFLLVAIILLLPIIIIKKKLLTIGEVIPMFVWVLGVIIFYTASSSPISEYYFANIEIIFLSIVSLTLYLIFNSSKAGQVIVLSILSIILVKNIIQVTTQSYYNKGYLERKGVAEYISKDAIGKGFPCVSVSYITQPGEDVGFRYFFYLNNLHVNQSKSGSPNYTIVIPDEYASDAIDQKFGHIGVIKPDDIPSKEDISHSCSGQNSNLTDPMFGFSQ